MTTLRQSERKVTAFMETGQPMGGNVIHSDEGAREHGYRAALVIGGYVYAWTVPAILDVLGEEWLDGGWASVVLRRPTYTGDALTARATLREDGTAEVVMQGEGGDTRL